jgi:hypothetical protein
MQGPGRGTVRPPIGIALDGDFGNRLDAVLALAMLNGLAAKGDARRIALCVSRPSLKAAQVADAVSGFYAGLPVASTRGGLGANPAGMIGMPESGPADETPPLTAVLTKKSASGVPLYTTTIARLRDTAENAVLVRNVLLAQIDGNAAIVLAGPATGLVRLVTLYGARPQVSAKARELVVACGSFPMGAVDPDIAADVSAARKLFAEWPTPIVAVGSEVGRALPYPAASIDTDFTWAQAHPVVDAYRALNTTAHDAPASALAAVHYAVHPETGYFKLSDPGTITVLDDGRTQFTPGRGTHRYLMADPSQTERVIKVYRDLVSAPPAPRPGRRGGGD